jgi:hypothetical protein
LESKRIFFLINNWPRYERSREVPIWNDFQIILFGVAVLFIYVFRSPLPCFCLFALSVLCPLGGRKRHKQTKRQPRIKWFGKCSKWVPHEIVHISVKYW